MMMAVSPRVEGIGGKGGRVHGSGRWGRQALGSLGFGFVIRATMGGLATVDGGTPAL
ncbi:hypothetical protein TIFTF001_014493 [Ficus carica]|uniref:Uncharacterized protein n=1 Tax=Ficus carica TaxID=3494 RepID=A0AA88AG44_FICCA|nr:hypothetical protein TIFTF001_014493 [Ficus carica]